MILAIGSQPNSQLFANQLELDEKGYIQLKKHQQTSIEGVFAIGDIADPEFKQAISAAGDGAKAALQTQKFLSTLSQADQLPASVKEKKQIIEITSRSQFEEHLKGANSVVFVDFYSSHCAPCRSFKPVFESWARDFQDRILFLQVNAEVAGELFNLYGVRFVPTLAIFDSQGNLLRKNSGPEIAAIEKFLRQYKDKQQIQPQDFD